jgi:hypothetical protein
MKTTQRFSVLIWADKRKADAAGLAPLYARITYLGKRAEISLKRRVHLAKWDCQTGFLKGTSPDAGGLMLISMIHSTRLTKLLNS